MSNTRDRFKCKWNRLLYKAAPLNVWKACLIGNHFQSCPACRALHEPSPELKNIGVQPEDIDIPPGLWQQINRQIDVNQTAGFHRPQPARRWLTAAAGAALLLLIIPLTLWWNTPGNSTAANAAGSGIAIENRDIIIHSIQVEHRPAQAVVFQSEQEDRVIIWVK